LLAAAHCARKNIMPIYEYRCQECRRVSSFLLLNLRDPFVPVCKQCGSHSLERVLSRVHVRLSEETRLERLADPSAWSGVDENDPKSVAKVLKKMGQEMGEDFPGEVDEMVEEAMDSQGGDAPGETDL
jgi:putative FmdB family regulatory protein